MYDLYIDPYELSDYDLPLEDIMAKELIAFDADMRKVLDAVMHEPPKTQAKALLGAIAQHPHVEQILSSSLEPFGKDVILHVHLAFADGEVDRSSWRLMEM